ncbi:MAG: hypothetical protein DI611_04490 [Brachybacterium faecium]|nr:MAG: hypothetical protein DI611_04490 [Brachybacterium faecium]
MAVAARWVIRASILPAIMARSEPAARCARITGRLSPVAVSSVPPPTIRTKKYGPGGPGSKRRQISTAATDAAR